MSKSVPETVAEVKKIRGVAGLLIHRVPLLSRNAEMKIITIIARNTIVATMRTGLNI